MTMKIQAKATPTGLLTEIMTPMKYVTNKKWMTRSPFTLKLKVDSKNILIRPFITVPIEQ
jgi:hypothetical protein